MSVFNSVQVLCMAADDADRVWDLARCEFGEDSEECRLADVRSQEIHAQKNAFIRKLEEEQRR